MSKYPIHPELNIISKFILPLHPYILPPLNLFLQLTFNLQSTPSSIEVTKHTITSYQDGKIQLTLFQPKGNTDKLPCLVYYHGGAFSLKATPHHKTLICEYVLKTPCKVMFVDYRLAPKYPFPTGVEDAYAGYRYVLDHCEELGINKNQIAVGGDSAGGSLAAAVCLMARDRHVPIPSFQFLIYPCTDVRQITKSMQDYTDTPIWNAKLTSKMWPMVLKNGYPIPKEYASPIEATTHHNLPNAYVEVAEFDCLHDEGIAYAKKLEESGVDVELLETKQTFHAFDVLTSTKFVKDIITHRISVLQKGFKQ